MTENPPELLHLDYRPQSAGWVLPLQSQLNGSSSPTLKARYQSWAASGMAEAGIAVSTRLMLVSRAIGQLTELEARLYGEIEKSGRLAELLEGGYVYTPDNPNSLYDICLAIDALLVECLALCEVVRLFTVRFVRKILGKKMAEQEFDALLLTFGNGGDWFEALTNARNFFLHESAPWLALRIHGRNPLRCELIVLKRNARDVSDPTAFISRDQLVDITRGLTAAVWGVQHWLTQSISGAGAPA